MTDIGQFDERMSDVDRILWVIESDPQLRSTITAVLFLAGAVDHDRLTRRVERASRRIVRLRQRVVSEAWSLGPPRWEIDPAFTPGYHLRWSHLAGAGTKRDVLRQGELIAMQSFDLARPLWEFTVVEGLVDNQCAVILKVHHSITDGVGGIALLLEVFDLDPDAADDQPLPPAPVGRPMSRTERFQQGLLYELARRNDLSRQATDGLVDIARDPVSGIKRSVDTIGSSIRLARPARRPMSPLLKPTSLGAGFDTISRPLSQLRRVAKAHDASINDLFVTALCRGLATWHRAQGLPLDTLRMGMPISTRDGSTIIPGNQFVPTRLEIPLLVADPKSHLDIIRLRLRTSRNEAALDFIDPLSGVLSRLPRIALTSLFASVLRGQDFLASNVVGAPIPLYLAGCELSAIVAFGPRSGTGLNCTLLSYGDDAQIGINRDPASIVDGDALRAHLEAGLDEMLALEPAATAKPGATARNRTTPRNARQPTTKSAGVNKGGPRR